MNRKYQPVKLEDLAKILNVSKVTISKALRNHPDISYETKEKVKQLADELGYIPNIMARNLSSRQSNTIGLVVPKIAHVFFSTVIESIYNEAFKEGYEIVLTVSQEQAEREKLHIQTLLSMKVDGLIISVTQETKDLAIFEKVIQMGKPIVFIDRVPKLDCVSCVTVDDFGGAIDAAELGVKKGYTKFAHIGGYRYINIGEARYKGFVEGMKRNNIPFRADWFAEGGFSEEHGYDGFMKICKKGEIPEYVFAVTYPVALGIYAAALELGIKIPQDVEVTCFGKNPSSGLIPSVFNYIDQPAKEIGQEAIKLMIERLNNPENFSPRKVELKTKLVISEPLFEKGVVV